MYRLSVLFKKQKTRRLDWFLILIIHCNAFPLETRIKFLFTVRILNTKSGSVLYVSDRQ